MLGCNPAAPTVRGSQPVEWRTDARKRKLNTCASGTRMGSTKTPSLPTCSLSGSWQACKREIEPAFGSGRNLSWSATWQRLTRNRNGVNISSRICKTDLGSEAQGLPQLNDVFEGRTRTPQGGTPICRYVAAQSQVCSRVNRHRDVFKVEDAPQGAECRPVHPGTCADFSPAAPAMQTAARL